MAVQKGGAKHRERDYRDYRDSKLAPQPLPPQPPQVATGGRRYVFNDCFVQIGTAALEQLLGGDEPLAGLQQQVGPFAFAAP